MTKDLVVAGFGGQGVMLLGQIIALAATEKGLNATWLPSYGPEQRGGTANCTVVVSDEEIASPLTDKPQFAVIMNNPSMAKFEPKMAAGGTLIYNSTLVTQVPARQDIKVVAIPANELAEQAGSARSANMVMLGVMAWVWRDVFTQEDLLTAMVHKVGDKRPQLLEINKKAFALGYEAAQKAI
ncbi:2-oxoacid:acceptor oxidoreductase family protein [Coprothermobacteraceae bacterium]|nr:2-oxoacid:acceptor oxidoreductase family protein [Coprothermobacteraceae bacterium]